MTSNRMCETCFQSGAEKHGDGWSCREHRSRPGWEHLADAIKEGRTSDALRLVEILRANRRDDAPDENQLVPVAGDDDLPLRNP